MDGILVRIGWNDVEPSPGVIDFSRLDDQIALAEAAGKRISLAVVNGPQAPVWLPSVGVETFTYMRNEDTITIPVPWDETHLERWTTLIEALGARFATEDTISLVYMTHASANGFEMQLPFSPVDQANWLAAGYTPELYTDSWEAVVDAFATAFPNHPLSHDVHPVLGSDDVQENVARYASETYGERMGILAAWWMERNAYEVYPGSFDVLVTSAVRTHAEVQVANSFTLRPDRFGPAGIAAEIDLALDAGIGYMEIWNSDLLNASLTSLMVDAAERLNGLGDPGPCDVVAGVSAEADLCCAADVDRDGDRDAFDIIAHAQAVRAEHPSGDFDGDGELTPMDTIGLLSAHAGCSL
ncbi:MAG: hypothetical protein CMJ31_03295 [Phycisphaerae bacterium]|nr:hypothetical protein [Phycisphaerae bacterium]